MSGWRGVTTFPYDTRARSIGVPCPRCYAESGEACRLITGSLPNGRSHTRHRHRARVLTVRDNDRAELTRRRAAEADLAVPGVGVVLGDGLADAVGTGSRVAGVPGLVGGV